jgi:fructosamine-3-kinase
VTAEVGDAIGQALSARVCSLSAISGGDINQAYRASLADNRCVFVKVNHQAPPNMFEAEAIGLDWLRAAKAISVPQVLAYGRVGAKGRTSFLVLEWLEAGKPSRKFDEHLGRRLAQLHRFGADRVGLDRDNYIGRLPQCNQPRASFREFFAEQRLQAQFAMARRAGYFDSAMERDFERLIGRLDTLLGDEEPPARLHGDLWSGNHVVGPDGEPWLIDPAVYGGHREIDLAMMRLFGGFGARVFSAYDEAFPLSPGYRERIHLMQLYPLLVHVNLFGGNYVAAVRQIIEEYLH